jgi:hypothetical protein
MLEEDGHYYEARIHDTVGSLLLWGHQKRGGHTVDYKAIVIPDYNVDENGRIPSRVGWVGLCLPYLDASIITHEALHIATSYLRLKGLLKLGEDIDDDEETLAYTLGTVMSQIGEYIYKRYR